jgi:hypothetical protein
MEFIKKYKMFTEEATMEAPVTKVKTKEPVVSENILQATADDVINRFARLYVDLPKEKKQQINKYFN